MRIQTVAQIHAEAVEPAVAGEDFAHPFTEVVLAATRVALVLGHVGLPGDGRQAPEVVSRTPRTDALGDQDLVEAVECLQHLVGVAAAVVPVGRRQDHRAVDVRERFTQLARGVAGLDDVFDDHDEVRRVLELDRTHALPGDVHRVRIDQLDPARLQRTLNEPGAVAGTHGDGRSRVRNVLPHEIPELSGVFTHVHDARGDGEGVQHIRVVCVVPEVIDDLETAISAVVSVDGAVGVGGQVH